MAFTRIDGDVYLLDAEGGEIPKNPNALALYVPSGEWGFCDGDHYVPAFSESSDKDALQAALTRSVLSRGLDLDDLLLTRYLFTFHVSPVKGDIIAVDMDGDGTAESYLVLKGSGTTFEVLARTTPTSGTSIVFDPNNTNTYYDTLSATAKAALVDKTFTQDSWYRSTSGDPNYNGLHSGTSRYNLSLGSATYGSEITRHIYALSVQDIIDYLAVTPEMTYENTTLTQANIQSMFNETGSVSLWLRSASASGTRSAFNVDCGLGIATNNLVDSRYQARPAFTIDLSKIEWSVANA